MPSVLVISSYVAASRVGGGLAPYVLGPLGVDPIHVPTTLLGRHPGWGPPGGGAVPAAQISGMLDGIDANGLFASIDAVFTGYFSTADQVDVAAHAIDRIRATPRSGAAPFVMVDPIMGDADSGRYVSEEVAAAQMRNLVPRADLVACNLWEFQALCGAGGLSQPDQAAAVARSTGREWLITSMATGSGIGALLVDADGARMSLSRRVAGRLPRGPGDLMKLRFLGGLYSGETREEALTCAVGLTGAVLERAALMGAAELPLAACRDLLSAAPRGWLEPVGG